jgi:hypothetical protein
MKLCEQTWSALSANAASRQGPRLILAAFTTTLGLSHTSQSDTLTARPAVVGDFAMTIADSVLEMRQAPNVGGGPAETSR